jgi:hypothetical protein
MKIFLAGGPSDVVQDVQRKLKGSNAQLNGHWEWKKRHPSSLPIGTELVLILTDMCGHADYDVLRRLAAQAGVPFVNGHRKWAICRPRLEAAGVVWSGQPAGPANAANESVGLPSLSEMFGVGDTWFYFED